MQPNETQLALLHSLTNCKYKVQIEIQQNVQAVVVVVEEGTLWWSAGRAVNLQRCFFNQRRERLYSNEVRRRHHYHMKCKYRYKYKYNTTCNATFSTRGETLYSNEGWHRHHRHHMDEKDVRGNDSQWCELSYFGNLKMKPSQVCGGKKWSWNEGRKKPNIAWERDKMAIKFSGRSSSAFIK